MKEGKPGNTREAQIGQSDKYQRIRDKNKELCTHNISNRRQRSGHAKGRKRAQRRKEKTINTIDYQEKESKNHRSLSGELKINNR